jgi:hypothetical protein
VYFVRTYVPLFSDQTVRCHITEDPDLLSVLLHALNPQLTVPVQLHCSFRAALRLAQRSVPPDLSYCSRRTDADPVARSQDVFCRPPSNALRYRFAFFRCLLVFEIITIRDEAVGCASGRERRYSPAKNVVTHKRKKSNSLTLRILYSGSVLSGRPTD